MMSTVDWCSSSHWCCEWCYSKQSRTQVSSLKLVTSPLERSTESKLYALMPKAFISDVDLSSSTITIRKQFMLM